MRLDIVTPSAAGAPVRVTPHGPIDAQSAPAFESEARAALGEKVRHLLVDMGDVEYVSSAGLQVFFALKRDLVARGGDLLFVRLKPQITKLFQVVNALPKESVFSTVEEADRYFYAIMNEEIRKRREEGR